MLYQINCFLCVLEVRNDQRVPRQFDFRDLSGLASQIFVVLGEILSPQHLLFAVHQSQLEIKPEVVHFAELPATDNDVVCSEVNLQVEEHVHRAVVINVAVEVVTEYIVGGVLKYFLIQIRIAQNLNFLVWVAVINLAIL